MALKATKVTGPLSPPKLNSWIETSGHPSDATCPQGKPELPCFRGSEC